VCCVDLHDAYGSGQHYTLVEVTPSLQHLNPYTDRLVRRCCPACVVWIYMM